MWATLPRVFDRVCAWYPDRTAIVAGEDRLSYREMGAWANRVANGLAELGVGNGEKVGMLMPNSLEFIPTQHGIWKSGAALVQMPARATADDLGFFLAEAGASTLIYHSLFDDAVAKIRTQLPDLDKIIRLGDDDTVADVLDYGAAFRGQPATAPLVDIDDDDLAYVAFTSGTTGVPKGLLQSHLTWSHYSITAGLEIADTRPGEVFVHVAPLTHFTQTFLMPTFMRGGTNVLLPSADIDLLMDVIARESATAVAVVPTILYLLLDHPRRAEVDLSADHGVLRLSHRTGTTPSGSGGVRPDLRAELRRQRAWLHDLPAQGRASRGRIGVGRAPRIGGTINVSRRYVHPG
jgi:acyl-CoA synthetase (AMP-forming)/AMP-acid ligase II